jgi:uncharacterized protein (TIGR02246 family)
VDGERRWRVRTAAATFLVTLALVSPAAAADTASLEAIEAEFAGAWAAHDAARMASFWAEDGDFMNPFGRFARGRAELEALFAEEQRSVMRASTYHFKLDSHRVLAPDVVVTDWTNEIRGMVAPGGEPLPPFTHHVTTVFVKRDGRWWKAAARAVALMPPAPPGE